MRKIDFKTKADNGEIFNLATVNKPIVLFFYPKDNTPGCTIENRDFASLYNEFTKLGYEVIGISRDSINSHCKFKEKYSLPFLLLADESEEICKMFDVIKNKKMYGKDVRGIERSTFIIDKNKNIIKEWRKVVAENHAKEVLEYISKL